jgi:hypothetical protein
MKSTIEKTWITKAGYEAEVVAHPAGHRCGYVTVPAGHRCEGMDYNDIDVSVHGGLTYSNGAKFGFDCAHYYDKRDESIMSEKFKKVYADFPYPTVEDGEVRTLEYCIEECEILAEQLKELE